MIRIQSYQFLDNKSRLFFYLNIVETHNVWNSCRFEQVLHGRRQLVFWGVRLTSLTGVTLVISWFFFCIFTFFFKKFLFLIKLPMRYRRKVRRTSGRYGLNGLGYIRATMVITIRCKDVNLSKSLKNNLSSDCFLQYENMK